MTHRGDILCIGSVLWDVIGRAPRRMGIGHDVPGRIERLPGGVAMNIAAACRREGLRPILLTVLGRDAEGRALADACAAMGLVTDHVTWADDLRTDRYMAIEAENGLVAAVADAHSLEEAGARILAPLRDGAIASEAQPWRGLVALDGNLTEPLLAEIAASPLFAAADLRVAPASPGKAARLAPLLPHARATVYVNRVEAALICGEAFDSAEAAARALVARGARRVLVTDGGAAMAEARADGTLVSLAPPAVSVCRVTGAGDCFMASHIAAEVAGLDGAAALEEALAATALYVSTA
ncbi:kinase [Rhodovulum sp. 12E13]|uniref:PfkB family carbohydrate kinase n=1 Tax=Rhodovulum sp. 12E13 TaxID=2203891 RepID=UPI000E145D88|nr:PfkB family carbohydrate kinase [Rhodovulum sp. 12E13]RDC71465.1 kinase [Rhodovulum sp. 12E13]